jgi:predicted nucleic acid-binding protein
MANAETVQLAKELKSGLVLADEEEVRSLVENYGFEVRSCLGVLIEAARARLIAASEAMKATEDLRS